MLLSHTDSYIPVRQHSSPTWNDLPVGKSFPFNAIKRPRLLSRTLQRELDGAARQLIWLFCASLSRCIPPRLTCRPCHMLFSPPPGRCKCSRWKQNNPNSATQVPTWLTVETEKYICPFFPSCLFYFLLGVYYNSCACTGARLDVIHHLCYLWEDKRETLQSLCWQVLADEDANHADMKYAIYSQVEIGITHSSCRFIKK